LIKTTFYNIPLGARKIRPTQNNYFLEIFGKVGVLLQNKLFVKANMGFWRFGNHVHLNGSLPFFLMDREGWQHSIRDLLCVRGAFLPASLKERPPTRRNIGIN
jgi:hypothetical protein